MDESMKDLPAWVGQVVVVLNVLLALAVKFGLVGALLVMVTKGWDTFTAWVHHWVEVAKHHANENRFLAATQLDDVLLDCVERAVLSTGQALKDELKKQLEAGKITPAEFQKTLHEDAKARLLASLSEGKKEVLTAAYKDLPGAVEALIPGVVKKLKDLDALGKSPNS